MRQSSARLAISLTGLAIGVGALSMPASAGDLMNGAPGGIKDYGSGGIPVPAPMPYVETFKWYLRGDIGTNFKTRGTITNDGLPVNVTQPNNWHESSILSLGFGRYITPSLRTEFTLDYRPERSIASGSQTVPDITKTARLSDVTLASGASAAQNATNVYSGNQNESDGYQNTTFLMSGFYDFNQGGRLKPYVGAGIGIGVHQLSRNGMLTYDCYAGTTTTSPYSGVGATTANTGCATLAASGLKQTYTSNANTNVVGYGLATQLSAGVSYDVSPRIHWDTGYRMLWQSGRLSASSADGSSTIRINDHTDHEIRTGVRWDVW